MGKSDLISDEMSSIFDELDSARQSPSATSAAAPRAATPTPAPAAEPTSSVDPIALPEAEPGEGSELASSVSQQVAEFLPLNRRRSHADPPLDPAEMTRWLELRELLEYAFGAASPPLGASNRMALRVATRLKVRSTGAGESIAVLRNLSESGAFIEVSEPPAVGSALSLEIETGGSGPSLSLASRVVWTREIGNMDGPAGLGVEFTAKEDRDAALLEKVFEHLLKAAAKQAG